MGIVLSYYLKNADRYSDIIKEITEISQSSFDKLPNKLKDIINKYGDTPEDYHVSMVCDDQEEFDYQWKELMKYQNLQYSLIQMQRQQL